MTESDVFGFNQAFADLRRVFPLRGDEGESRQLVASYFTALRRFTLPQVQDGAQRWIASGERFPRPKEWATAIPRRSEGVPIPELASLEASEWLNAERLRWEGEPCNCPACREASVEHRFLRFVPDEDHEQKGRIGERVVMRGHWAHGWELKRWYQARDAFYATCRALKLEDAGTRERTPFEERLRRIFAKLGKELV